MLDRVKFLIFESNLIPLMVSIFKNCLLEIELKLKNFKFKINLINIHYVTWQFRVHSPFR